VVLLVTISTEDRNNFDHQMKEGFLFYNSELFSQDDSIVPVKNPTQFWSQLVDDLVG